MPRKPCLARINVLLWLQLRRTGVYFDGWTWCWQNHNSEYHNPLVPSHGQNRGIVRTYWTCSQRLTEVSSLQARTIHRLLEWSPQEGGFLHDEVSPLTAQVVLSMKRQCWIFI